MELYGCGSPNVTKVHLLIKELGIEINYHTLNIRKGDQYAPDYLKINPNGKLPALIDNTVDGEPITVFESGNILLYLATKYGKFIPNAQSDPHGHTEVLNWVFWQMANLGPAFGNYYHFVVYAQEKHPYSINRYFSEIRRLFHVLNNTLHSRTFIAGEDYSIADMCIYPWLRYISLVPDFKEDEFPKLFAYLARLKAIPSVVAFEKIEEEEKAKNPQSPPTDEERKIMFNRDRLIMIAVGKQKEIKTTKTEINQMNQQMIDDIDITSILGSDIDELSITAEDQKVIKDALLRGLDLRVYAREVEQELNQVDKLTVADYISEVDGVLASLETMLNHFYNDLKSIGSEMSSLEQRSTSMDYSLTNRTNLKLKLSEFIDVITIAPNLESMLTKGDINEDYITCLKMLDTKITLFGDYKMLAPGVCQSNEPKLNRLRVASMQRIHRFLKDSLSFKRLSERRAVQQRLAGMSDLFLFHFKYNEDGEANEVINTYVESSENSLLKMAEDAPAKGIATTKLKTFFGGGNTSPTPSTRSPHPSAGKSRRVDLLLPASLEAAPIEPPASSSFWETATSIASSSTSSSSAPTVKYPYEQVYRSLIFFLMDLVSAELQFVKDFFLMGGDDMISSIFQRSMALIIIFETTKEALKTTPMKELRPINYLIPHPFIRKHIDLLVALHAAIPAGSTSFLRATGESLASGCNKLLHKMSDDITDPTQVRIFLINNYASSLAVIQGAKIDSEKEASSQFQLLFDNTIAKYVDDQVIILKYFDTLYAFTAEWSPLVESHVKIDPNSNPSFSATAIDQILSSFEANYKSAASVIRDNSIRHFAQCPNASHTAYEQFLVSLYHRYRQTIDIVNQYFPQLQASSHFKPHQQSNGMNIQTITSRATTINSGVLNCEHLNSSKPKLMKQQSKQTLMNIKQDLVDVDVNDLADLDITSILRSDIDDDSITAEDQQVIKDALRKGIDLKQYAKEVEQELNQIDKLTVADYFKERDDFLQLYTHISAVDGVLGSLETMLNLFYNDLKSIGSEMSSLEERSTSMDFSLTNRTNLKEKLSEFIDVITIAPNFANMLTKGDINEDFIMCLKKLDTKITLFDDYKILAPGICATNEPQLSKLTVASIQRIQKFLKDSLSFKRLSERRAVQQQLAGMNDLFQFLFKYHAYTANEVINTYVENSEKYYTNYYRNYTSSLLKMAEDAPAKGIATTKLKTLFGSNNNNTSPTTTKSNQSSKSRRVDLLTTDSLEAAWIEPPASSSFWETATSIASSSTSSSSAPTVKYPYEQVYRSLVFFLMDLVSAELQFVKDFFLMGGDDMISSIFQRPMALIIIFETTKEALKTTPMKELRPINYLLPHPFIRKHIDLLVALHGVMPSVPTESNAFLRATCDAIRNGCEKLLHKMGEEVSDPSEIRIFLINNYASTLTVVGAAKTNLLIPSDNEKEVCGQFVSLFNNGIHRYIDDQVAALKYFGTLFAFTAEWSPLVESHVKIDPKENPSFSAAAVEQILSSFDANWKSAVAVVRDNTIRHFAQCPNASKTAFEQFLEELYQRYRQTIDIVNQCFPQLQASSHFKPHQVTKDIRSMCDTITFKEIV
eukprot:gene11974-13966_t